MPDPNKWFTKAIHNYYIKCQRVYCQNNNIEYSSKNYIYSLGPFNNFYNISNEIKNISIIIKDILDNGSCKIPNKTITYKKCDILFKSSDKKNILAKYINSLSEKLYDELIKVSTNIINILEKDLQTYLLPYNYAIYRNLEINSDIIKNNSKIFGNGAWNFHCDHDPPFKIKVFTYLNDINENKAPFEIIYNLNKQLYPKLIPYGNSLWSWGVVDVSYKSNDNESNKNPYFLEKNKKVYPINPNTRIPKGTINKLLKNGYIKKKILGKKGTMFPTQTGLIHKANIANEGYRDILVLECVPSLQKIDKSNYKKYFQSNIDTKTFYKELIS